MDLTDMHLLYQLELLDLIELWVELEKAKT
jgi:hypothetical protein